MEVNIEKTKAMKFSGNEHKCKSVFLYNGKPLENVPKYKYTQLQKNPIGHFLEQFWKNNSEMKIYATQYS